MLAFVMILRVEILGNGVKKNHNLRVCKLVKFWVDYMENKCEVLKIYPFLGVAQSLLLKEVGTLLRCGAGWINYAIPTGGHIVPCPAMWGMKDYYLGHIESAAPLKLKKVFIGNPCVKCDIFNMCSGRCLYANVTKRWTPEAYSLVCSSVRNLINALTKELPRIRRIIVVKSASGISNL